ncbi:MAG: hypothetical protein IE880_05195 [Epsilonproteobacteria bacterium]|nr:hypothetical protein [Campylobacterota bacterium]
MKHKLQAKIEQIAQNPKILQTLQSMKPEKSIWGFLGIVLFLIVPEIVAFIWGIEIATYAQVHKAVADSMAEEQYYNLLILVFAEGGSWFNLAIGAAFLIWFFV